MCVCVAKEVERGWGREGGFGRSERVMWRVAVCAEELGLEAETHFARMLVIRELLYFDCPQYQPNDHPHARAS